MRKELTKSYFIKISGTNLVFVHCKTICNFFGHLTSMYNLNTRGTDVYRILGKSITIDLRGNYFGFNC